MSNRFLAYLEREHARLEQALAVAERRRPPDGFEVARIKKQKLIVKDQIAHWQSEKLDA